MKFRWSRLLPVIAMTVTCGVFSAPSQADLICDAPPPAIWPLLPELPKGCQRERIQASGGLSFGVLKSADKLAEQAWQREVLTKYGERYQDIKFAACLKKLCVKGAVSGTTRCTISGFPCAVDMDPQMFSRVTALANQDDGQGQGFGPGPGPDYGYGRPPQFSELNEPELRELQRFLGVTPDGIFGQESQEALRRFRRTVGIGSYGPPTRADLIAIRRRG